MHEKVKEIIKGPNATWIKIGLSLIIFSAPLIWAGGGIANDVDSSKTKIVTLEANDIKLADKIDAVNVKVENNRVDLAHREEAQKAIMTALGDIKDAVKEIKSDMKKHKTP